jgi:cell wall-associated NlpC family hydrolase
VKTLAALSVLPVLGAVSLVVFAAGTSASSGPSSGAGSCRLVATGVSVWLDGEQVGDAGVIDAVGRRLGVPRYGEVIALATAWQESDLRNLPYGDRDSLGLFQRPSQGWGTPAQILDPVYASAAFYARLLAVPGWQQRPLTVDAQAVQRSAHPSAYARWQPAATAADAALTGLPGAELDCPSAAAGTIPTGLPAPTSTAAAAAIVFALEQLGKPYRMPPDPPTSWDCSSLVQAAYAAAGITLPRTTYQQVSGSGPWLPLDPAAWQPGDLLFSLGDDPRDGLPGHVGVYLGDGYLVEAPHTGATVTVTSLPAYGSVVAATRPWLLSPRTGPAR